MPERTRWTLSAVLTIAVAVAFGLDSLAWRDASQSFLHSDGIIHLERLRRYAAALRGQPVHGGVDVLVGYGPIPYQIGARVLLATGAEDWAAAVPAWIAFGMVGVAGAGLLAGRLGGPWAAPAAAALLAGLPVWRTHSIDLLPDGPGAAVAVLALGALAWSDGLRRPGWSLAAGLVTGAALVTRWPVAFLLAPAWAVAVTRAAWRGRGPAALRALGVVGIGALTGLLLVGPVLWLPVGLRGAQRLGAAGVAGAAAVGLVLAAPRDGRGWLPRALGAGVAVVASAWPAILWAPGGFLSATTSQLAMEDAIATTRVAAPGAWHGLPGALGVLSAWWTGPLLGLAVGVGLVLALRRRPAEAGLVATGAVVNLVVPLELLAQPDERHLLASLPVGIALAASLAAGRAGPVAGPLFGIIGLSGLLAWHGPGLPGVVPSRPWQRDINVVRGAEATAAASDWHLGSPPWRSIRPYTGNPYAAAADVLLGHFGRRGGCIAWLVTEPLRSGLPFHKHVHRIEPPLLEAGAELQGEDPYDRPGARLGDYDGAVVWSPAGSTLPGRAAAGLGGATVLERVPLAPAFDVGDVTLTVLVVPDRPPAPAGCDERFPGTEIRPLGSGWSASDNGPLPGLPP